VSGGDTSHGEGSDAVSQKAISLAVNVLLLASGVGEIRAAIQAKNYVQLALASADVLVGVGGIIIDNVLYDKLNRTEGGREFLSNWATFNMIYGAASFTSNIASTSLDTYISGKKTLKEIEENVGKIGSDGKVLERLSEVPGPGGAKSEKAKMDDILNTCLAQGGCFLPNTPIATPTGLTPIQNIKIGTLVNTYDETTQQNTTKTVTNIFTKTTNKIYDIIIGSDTLHATPEHPFYTNGKWTIAQNLRKGMNLLTLAGMLLPITQINAHDTLATVHNFEVQDAHTYYVGKQQTLVHNLCAPLTLCPAMRELIDATPTLKPHLTKIEQWAADANIGNELVLSLKEDIKAFDDFARLHPGNTAKVSEALDSWLILRKNNSTFVRNSGAYLNKFNNLDPNVQALVARFTDVSGSSTLANFLDECNDINFKIFVNDPQNITFVRQMLAHKKDVVVTDDQLELIAETLLNKPLTPVMNKVESWISRSAGVTKFLEKTADGVFYGNRALTTLLKNTPNDAVTTNLLNGLGITNLADYKIFNEVQLWVNEGAGHFMKGDIMLVKFNGNAIDEVILIENKLSAGTLLTARQNVGVTTLKNGGTLKVKAPSSSKKIETINGVETIVPEIGANAKTIGKDIDISVAANKRKKISDGGNKNGAFNVSGLEPN
jgi:Pretoxin HINT domain